MKIKDTEIEKISDEEFNLVTTFTRKTHLDEMIDIDYDEGGDFFYDFFEEERLSLTDGFKILADAQAYPFTHEGFTKEESDKLTALFQRFVPNYVEQKDVEEMKENVEYEN